MNIRIQVEDKVSGELERIQAAMRPAGLQQLAFAAASHLRELADDAFKRSGAEYAPWAPRKDRSSTHRILQKTSNLRKSLTVMAEASGAAVVSSAEYAAIHQFGGTIERAAGTRISVYNGKGKRISKAKAERSKAGAVGVKFHDVKAHDTVIPARPFVPVTLTGELMPNAARTVETKVRAKFNELLKGYRGSKA